MNRFLLIIGVFGLLLTGAMVADAAYAQTTLSEEDQQQIRTSCVTIQATLRQLLDSDVNLRNDRIDLYGDISNKLMVPLNGRIASNKLDGLRLGSLTRQYDDQLRVFRTSYTDYAKSMEDTINMECAKQPIEFYESVIASRDKRQKVYEANQTVLSLLQTYENEFDHFATSLKGDG